MSWIVLILEMDKNDSRTQNIVALNNFEFQANADQAAKICHEMFQSTQIMAELMDFWYICMMAHECQSSIDLELLTLIRLKEKFQFFLVYLMHNHRQEMQG